MAHCKLTPQEFIRDAFTPQVAVICSPKVEEISQKNNLSFCELLQPFCKLGTGAYYKDPTGNVVSIRNFKISLQDINFRPPQPALARKFLNSSVSDAPDPRFQTLQVGEYTLHTPTSAPWFEQWRDTFLHVQFPSDHEFTKHYIACMMVISTSDEDPLQMMVELAQKVNDLQASNKLPKWFSPNILRYYIVIHEKHDPHNIHAVECFDDLKMQFGNNNVFLLRTNSRKPSQSDETFPDPWSQFISAGIQIGEYVSPQPSPTTTRAFALGDSDEEVNENGGSLTYHPLSPEQEKPAPVEDSVEMEPEKAVVHGAYLTIEDVEQLKLLIHEFCTRALFPFIEQQVSNLHEFITNKKGVSRSFISATKRWFTPTKQGGGPTGAPPTYFPFSPELQVRRLGDLYFMFGHYTMAFQAYHTVKRDFNTDQAWLLYAGALEMAALSAFMANETSRKTLDYMEESITTYLNNCKLAQFATRATLLSSECLKGKQMYGEAAHQLIRMTSEESDLRSALLLEQAAYCFLLSTRPCMVRKYAFHMVLAGHRFSKAAQRKHSFRCYKQAFEVYDGKGWNLAHDHIQYTLGRQANNLDLLEEAVMAFSKLLSDQSKQSAEQQAMFLKEYATMQNLLSNKNGHLQTPILPLPILDTSLLKLLVAPTPPLRTPGKVPAISISLSHTETSTELSRWSKLEEMLVQEAQGSLPMIFKPVITLFTKQNAFVMNPIAIMGEPIQVAMVLRNPLQITLVLKDVHILWTFNDGREKVNNENGANCDQFLKTHYIKNIELEGNSSQEVVLTLTPLSVGNLTLLGISYSLVSSLSTEEDEIEVKGKLLFKRKVDDKRFEIKMVPPAPCLQVNFGEINSDVLKNELQQVSMELRNVGTVPLHKIYIATSKPELLSCREFAKEVQLETVEGDSPAAREREIRRNHVTNIPLPQGQLDPGQSKTYNLWLQALNSNSFDLLIYYENVDSTSIPRYRVVRHWWNFQIHDSIKLDSNTYHGYTSENVEKLSLAVRVSNLNKVRYPLHWQIMVLNTALLSTKWKLLDEIVNPDALELGLHNSAQFLLKAKPRDVSQTNDSYSVLNFISDSSRYSEAAYLDFASRFGRPRVNVFEESTESFDLKEGMVIVRWRGKIVDSSGTERYVYGQNQIVIDLAKKKEEEEGYYKGPVTFYGVWDEDYHLLAKIRDREEALLKQQQIRCDVMHPPKVIHNFKLNRLCVINIKLSLHSTNVEADLEVIIKTLETTNPLLLTSPKLPLFTPYASKYCRWVGLGSVTRRIPPLRSETIELSLGVVGPGTYDLGSHLEIWCQRMNKAETPTLQTCQVPSAVIVVALE